MNKKADEVIDDLEDLDDIDLDISTPTTEITDSEDLDDLDLEDVPDLKDEVTEELKEEAEKVTSIDLEDDDDIPDLSVDTPETVAPKMEVVEEKDITVIEENLVDHDPEGVTPPPPVEKPKARRGKSKTTTKTVDGKVIIFDPVFDITKIKTNKYQSRKTHRTNAQVKELAEKINLQGQLEPTHILKDGTEYQMLAGFGRMQALTLLKSTTIKVLIHDNLTEDEIMTYSFGTNEGRLELSELDKIYSVGEFIKAHPDMPVDGDGVSVVGVFGYGKSKIYDYARLFGFFSISPEWLAHFQQHNYPLFIFNRIEEKKTEIKDVGKTIGFLEKGGWENSSEFKLMFAKFLSQSEIKEQVELNVEKLTEEQTQLDIELETSTQETTSTPTTPAEKDNAKAVAEHVTKIKNGFATVSKLCKSLTEIADYKTFLQTSDLKDINTNMKELSKQLLHLV